LTGLETSSTVGLEIPTKGKEEEGGARGESEAAENW